MSLSDSVVQEIRRVLAERDIEGLIEAGAPRDEYDSEAREVAFKWQQNQEHLSEEALYDWLKTTWMHSFGLGEEEMLPRENELRAAADDILRAGEK